MFLDHAANFIFHCHQVNITSAASIHSKHALEFHLWTYGIKPHQYASDNHPFASKEWIVDCNNTVFPVWAHIIKTTWNGIYIPSSIGHKPLFFTLYFISPNKHRKNSGPLLLTRILFISGTLCLPETAYFRHWSISPLQLSAIIIIYNDLMSLGVQSSFLTPVFRIPRKYQNESWGTHTVSTLVSVLSTHLQFILYSILLPDQLLHNTILSLMILFQQFFPIDSLMTQPGPIFFSMVTSFMLLLNQILQEVFTFLQTVSLLTLLHPLCLQKREGSMWWSAQKEHQSSQWEFFREA